MASQVGIKPIELHKIILPQLEESSDKRLKYIEIVWGMQLVLRNMFLIHKAHWK